MRWRSLFTGGGLESFLRKIPLQLVWGRRSWREAKEKWAREERGKSGKNDILGSKP